MPSVQELPTQSYTSNNESVNSAMIISPHQEIVEIAARPDFNVFTSMLWIRRPNQSPDGGNQSGEAGGNTCRSDIDVTAIDGLQPDLGLLPFHRERLAASAEALGWRDIRALERTEHGLNTLRSSISYYLRCLPELPQDRIERRKLRLLITKKGVITVDSTVMDSSLISNCGNLAANLPPQSLDLDLASTAQLPDQELCQVFINPQPCKASVFTTHKTSHREHYNEARRKMNVTTAPTVKEVLIYNENGEVMEASLSTVYFLRGGAWITPAAICGGNLGVTRRLALEKGLCKQGNIEISELQDGEKIWLSNGARGFFVGRICFGGPNPPAIVKNGTSS